MTDVLLILHFIGLGMGISASVGNIIIMRLIAASPQDRPVLGRFPPVAVNVGAAGVVLLWITGILMVFTAYDGAFSALGWTFAIKILFVIIVTVMVGLVHMTLKKLRQGDASAAGRLPVFGQIAGVSLLLVVVFAVLTFH